MTPDPRLPAPLREVVDRLSRLPGLGPKSALRAAMEILKWPRESAEALGQSILNLRERLCFCTDCLSLSEADPCPICSDPTRDASQLCIVGEWDSLVTLEQGGFFKGRYLVLGGLIRPLDGVGPEGLHLDVLERKLEQGTVREIILALGTTLEAEATASHIRNLVSGRFSGVSVTRLAQGIPLGSEVKYVDHETLRQSLKYRQKL